MTLRQITTIATSFLGLALMVSAAHAVPVQGVFVDDPARCDSIPQTNLTHELGDVLQGFPIDEGLDIHATLTSQLVCVNDDGVANDYVVTMVNLSSTSWVDLFFVADDGVFIGNADGSAADLTAPGFTDAFKIDNVGVNANLIGGDNGNLIFEPGEAWRFLVSNFLTPGNVPPTFGSIGQFAASSSANFKSTASILATPMVVPEPSAVAMTFFSVLGVPVLIRRRLRRGRRGIADRARCTHGSVGLGLLVIATTLLWLTIGGPVRAELGSFETADGYTGPFTRDVWSYDAGQTGALFVPSQYNTGRWVELAGSGNASGDAQYISQHGFISSANAPPYALAVRAISPSTDGTYDMSVRYELGVDDLGIAPSTALQSASIGFDICPGRTVIPNTGFDTVFNDVPAFTLGFGGTNAAPGAMIGFSDHDPGNASLAEMVYFDGSTYNSQPVAWSPGRFDHIDVELDFVNQTFDLLWTKDANLSTKEFDAGNTPITIASGASFTSSISMLDYLYFRTYTDPGNGMVQAGLDKSFLDNFEFRVTAATVPEPSSILLSAMGFCGIGLLARRRKARRS